MGVAGGKFYLSEDWIELIDIDLIFLADFFERFVEAGAAAPVLLGQNQLWSDVAAVTRCGTPLLVEFFEASDDLIIGE